ncbi:hypothetical protein DM02DRAFT_627223 [Periconia macrospinosa]|uniref:C3H1-type domain-containing protein n=1 Tax=Periconia macrospinosa TaxID=97972 RepID=A0A2V1DX59_9PLEO|nr:hypothetical protein DM02DRAFT_627223 [Periconia macrospinosa]
MSSSTHRPGWWEATQISDRLEWSYLSLERCTVTIPALMNESNTPKPTKFIGPQEYLGWLANYIHAGYRYQNTRGDGRCGIWAITHSLRPIYQLRGMNPPLFERLYMISQSQQVKDLLKDAEKRDNWDHETLKAHHEVREVKPDWLEHYQISATLRILGEEDNLELGFGVLTRMDHDSYTVSVDAAFRRKNGSGAERPWDGIVWIHNVNNIHWSGIAPTSDDESFNQRLNSEAAAKLRFVAPESMTQDRNQTPQNSMHSPRNIIPQETWSFEQLGKSDDIHIQEQVGQDEKWSFVHELPHSPASPKHKRSDSADDTKKRFPPHQHQHRPSYDEMDVDELVDSITPDEKQMLRDKGFPDDLEVRKIGDSVFISMKMSDWLYANNRMPLYYDIEGAVPVGHKYLNEIDHEIGPWFPREKDFRVKEAIKKSARPIMNAPMWVEDLPWDEIDGISIEEFILYFPNHATKWPGIALYIRCQNWDRLFYRIARIINLGRGTHNSPDPDMASIQVLPLMIKMQHAIRFFNPDYNIGDRPNVDDEFIQENMKTKPVDFPTCPRMASVAEADDHVAQWTNEFHNRPFSRKMKETRFQIQQQKADERLKHFPFRKFDVNDNEWKPDAKPYPNRGWDVPMPLAPSLPPTPAKPSAPKASSKFDDLLDDELEPSPTFSPPPPVLGACNYDRRCTRADCKFAHHGPATTDDIPIETGVEMCRFGLSCLLSKCNRPHPSPGGAPKAKNVDKQGRERRVRSEERNPRHGKEGGNRDRGKNTPKPDKPTERKSQSLPPTNHNRPIGDNGEQKGPRKDKKGSSFPPVDIRQGNRGKGDGKSHDSGYSSQKDNKGQDRGNHKDHQGKQKRDQGGQAVGGTHTRKGVNKNETHPKKDGGHKHGNKNKNENAEEHRGRRNRQNHPRQ